MIGRQPINSIREGSRPKILFVTPSLRVGGAEVFLTRLVDALVPRFDITVVNLGPEEELTSTLRDSGTNIQNLNMRSLPTIMKGLMDLTLLVWRERPDVLQGWMYLGDIAAGLASVPTRRIKVFGSIRMTRLPIDAPFRAKLARTMAAAVNRFIMSKTISCDVTASQIHSAHGFPLSKIIEIPNIVPRHEEFPMGERSWPSDPVIVGTAARYDEGKGHLSLALAIDLLAGSGLNVSCLFAGRDCEPYGPLFERLATEIPNPKASFIFMGAVPPDEMSKFYQGLDVYVMASDAWEGFPNALAEAAGMGVPALATDIGSAKHLIPDIRLLESSAPSDIASALERLIRSRADEVRELTDKNRIKVLRTYSSESVAELYLKTWFG